jgi:hypothetical protein
MTLDQNSLIAIAFILSITLIGVIALTRNTDTKLDFKLGKDKSLTIEGKRSLSEQTKVDCLPGEENSQLLKCNS